MKEVARPRFIYEFFGTALMIYARNLGPSSQFMGLAYFIGWILSYHVSGAEFNPSISIANMIVKKEAETI